MSTTYTATHPTTDRTGTRESKSAFTHAVILESGEIKSAHTSLKAAEKSWRRLAKEDPTAALVTMHAVEAAPADATPSEPQDVRLDEAVADLVPVAPVAPDAQDEPVTEPPAEQEQAEAPAEPEAEPTIAPGARILVKVNGRNRGATVVEVKDDGRVVALLGKVPGIVQPADVWKVQKAGTDELAREAAHLYAEAVKSRQRQGTGTRQAAAVEKVVEARVQVKATALADGATFYLGEKAGMAYTLTSINDTYPGTYAKTADGKPMWPVVVTSRNGSNRYLAIDVKVWVPAPVEAAEAPAPQMAPAAA